MNPFGYARASQTNEALELRASERGARYIAGGTNVLDYLREGVERPPLLVDINLLPLREVRWNGSELHVGALARMSEVAADPSVRRAFPALAAALEESASPQLRNMASIGGNLLQHTRCPYFRDIATPCNRREPASGCGARGGDDRKAAVLGTSERCIATHPSDLAVALAALDAQVHAVCAQGERRIPFADFYRLPGDAPHLTTALREDELITGVSIAGPPFAERSTYLKVRDRAQFDFALASAAVALDMQGGRIRDARVALGGVATIPWRSPEAESALRGRPPERDAFEAAAEAALAKARPFEHNAFKIPLAKRTLVRALEMLGERP